MVLHVDHFDHTRPAAVEQGQREGEGQIVVGKLEVDKLATPDIEKVGLNIHGAPEQRLPQDAEDEEEQADEHPKG
jgi:hypothetical protein